MRKNEMSIVEEPAKRRRTTLLFDASRGDRGTAKPRKDPTAPGALKKPAPAPKAAAPKPVRATMAAKAPPQEPAVSALRSTVGNVKALAKMPPEAISTALAQPGLAAEVASAAGWLRAAVKRSGALAPVPSDEGRARSHLNRTLKEVGGLAKAPTDVLVDMICRLPPDVLERLGAAGEFMAGFANAGDAEPDIGEMLAEAAGRLEAMPSWKRTRVTTTLDPDALRHAAAVLTALAERRARQDEAEDKEPADVDAR